MATVFITTGSDPQAWTIYEQLKVDGFDVYDPTLADTASLVVFNTSRRKVATAIKKLKELDMLDTPSTIRTTEIPVGRQIFKTRKPRKYEAFPGTLTTFE